MKASPRDMPEGQAMVDITEHGYYVAMWFLSGPGQDMLGVIHRPEGATELRFDYRFRYYRDQKIWETNDDKRFYAVTFDPDTTDDAAIEIVRTNVIDILVKERFLGTRLPWAVKKHTFHRVIKGGGKAMSKVIEQMPDAHRGARPPRRPGAN